MVVFDSVSEIRIFVVETLKSDFPAHALAFLAQTRLQQATEQILNAEGKVVLKEKCFYAWPEDDKDVINNLIRNGWTYKGPLVPDGREDWPHNYDRAIENKEIDLGPCLILSDDGEAKRLQGLSPHHLISQIPEAHKSLTKAEHQLLFNDEPFFPRCFTLPDEREKLLEVIENEPNSHFITKPDDGYGGQGMLIYKGQSEILKRRIRARREHKLVVQRYMENPYLLADLYKFHFRCYMVITNTLPLRAHLYKNCQLQFATHPFELKQIGKQAFNRYSHITNYKVNNEPGNMKFAKEDKPGIGVGTEWSFETFANYMQKENPTFSVEKFWTDLAAIAKVVSKKLTDSRFVQQSFEKSNFSPNHFEIYGLDILMDDSFNLRMAECNVTPGLDDTSPTRYGEHREETVKANEITWGIVNDTLTLVCCENKKMFSPFIALH